MHERQRPPLAHGGPPERFGQGGHGGRHGTARPISHPAQTLERPPDHRTEGAAQAKAHLGDTPAAQDDTPAAGPSPLQLRARCEARAASLRSDPLNSAHTEELISFDAET